MSTVLGHACARRRRRSAGVVEGSSARAAAACVESLVLRLVAFAALAAFATAHWGMLVEDAPAGRELLVVLVATGGAAAWRWSDAPRCHAPRSTRSRR